MNETFTNLIKALLVLILTIFIAYQIYAIGQLFIDARLAELKTIKSMLENGENIITSITPEQREQWIINMQLPDDHYVQGTIVLRNISIVFLCLCFLNLFVGYLLKALKTYNKT